MPAEKFNDLTFKDLNKVISVISHGKSPEKINEISYEIIKDFWFSMKSDSEKVEMVKKVIDASESKKGEIKKLNEEKNNKVFRTLTPSLLEKRKLGEQSEFPKSFRYWYYYGENKNFLDWLNEMLDQSFIASDIISLACTVRDQYNKKGLEYNLAKKAMKQLNQIDQMYNLDILQDIKGIEGLI